MAYWLFSPKAVLSPRPWHNRSCYTKQKKEGRTPAKSAVDAFFFLDYTDHDSDKAEMMTDAAVISKPLRKIGGIFQT